MWKEAEEGGKRRYREERNHYYYFTGEVESEKMDKPIQGLLTLLCTPPSLSPTRVLLFPSLQHWLDPHRTTLAH